MDESSEGKDSATTPHAGDGSHILCDPSLQYRHQQPPLPIERTTSTNSSTTSSSSSSNKSIPLEPKESKKPMSGEPKIGGGEVATATATATPVLPSHSSLMDLGERKASVDSNSHRAPASDYSTGGHQTYPHEAQKAPLPQDPDGATSSSSSSVRPSRTSNNQEEVDPMKQPPLLQSMARPAATMPATAAADVPDPYRIPSSVFARTKSTAPMEWSVASNESLFSIHMGNNSFSRDHVFLLGKSGELPSYLNSGPLDANGNVVTMPPNDPYFPTPPPSSITMQQQQQQPPPPPPPSQQQPPPLPSTGGKAVAGAVDGGAQNGLKVEQQQKVEKEQRVDQKQQQQQPEKAVRTLSTPRHSDGSITSIQSFAFPILTGERGGSIRAEPQLQQHHLHPQPGGPAAKAQLEERKKTGTPAAAEAATANSSAPSWCPNFLKCTLCCPR